MKILDRYLYKELAKYSFALILIFSVLIISSQLVHLPDIFFHINAVEFLKALFLINLSYLKIQFLFAVGLAFLFLGLKLKENREIYAIYATGVSDKYLLKKLSLFSIGLVVIGGTLAFFLVPMADIQRAKFITDKVRNHFLDAIQPDNFVKIPGGNVIYVSEKKGNTFKNVFLYNQRKNQLITAKKAKLEKSVVRLYDGMVQVPTKDSFNILAFKEYIFKVSVAYTKDFEFSSLPTEKLLKLAKSHIKKERLLAITTLANRLVYTISILFVGLIGFLMAIRLDKEKEFILGIFLASLVIYLALDHYLLKLAEKGKINPIIYIAGVLTYLTAVLIFLYKRR